MLQTSVMTPFRRCGVSFNDTLIWRVQFSVPLLRSHRKQYSTHPYNSFPKLVRDPASKYQIYISRSNNPYANLAFEHFLLRNTPADSNVLFLYTNRPSIVIGRNQNPWLEVNLGLLDRRKRANVVGADYGDIGDVLLVRRRSGGGTVFHDEGNVNYCVICPTAEFTRDKHAEMVVKAIRRSMEAGANARVNERHDIVLDQGSWDKVAPTDKVDLEDTHTSAFQKQNAGPPLKISGSAYKLIRLRALHHGTCLLASPNLSLIHSYLTSPAKDFIKARGVDSVRSHIGNLSAGNSQFKSAFEEAVITEFRDMHGLLENNISPAKIEALTGRMKFHANQGMVFGILKNVNEDWNDIGKGLAELKVCPKDRMTVTMLTVTTLQSTDWIYNQTPQFILSSHPCDEDPRERPPLPPTLPSSVCLLTPSKGNATQRSKDLTSVCD